MRGLRLLLLGVAILAGTSLGACSFGDGMHSKLMDASSGYNRNLRWGDVDRASEYLPQASRNAFLAQQEELEEELVIVDYDVTRLSMDKHRGTATSRAEISWHTDRRLILEHTVVDQAWQWHDARWVLVDERRVSGTPLAMFAEVEETRHPYLPGIEAYRKAHKIGEEDSKGRGRSRRGRRGERPSGPAQARR
jgi:hypothetical protein